jgi:glucose-6-phosphate 1-dehydrogenase
MKTKIDLNVHTHHNVGTEERPGSSGIVIFGASGDLAHRKLYPALFDLYYAGHLPENFFVIGFARSDWNDQDFRKQVLKTLKEIGKPDPAKQKKFVSHLYYRVADLDDTASFHRLAVTLKELDQKYKTQGNVMYHLAIPPEACGNVVAQLDRAHLINPSKKGGPWTRVIFEKPFGHDLESARALNHDIHQYLKEEQIYRIDHYLGKETVQNILMFRFANSIFEPIWNRRYIDNIQIMVYETLGVEQRAAYYDHAGVIKDMFQNHILQLLALCTMEPPIRFNAEQYRDEKTKVFHALRPIPKGKVNDYVVRGQYGPGKLGAKKVIGYRQEEGVNSRSQTDTFVAMKLFIDNWRWQGVPFYLRSGKRMNAYGTEILIQFKQIPHSMFFSVPPDHFASNILCFRVQPDEGISLRIEAKQPGPEFSLASLNFNFEYKNVFHTRLMGPYERLLLDCMHGDQTLFIREDQVELSWAFIDRILEEWKKSPGPKFPNYASGSWGPEVANKLIEQDGRKWRNYVANYSATTDEHGKKL